MTEEQRQERLNHHMYDTCEGIKEQSERIVALEELVGDLWAFVNIRCKDCDEWVQLSVSVGTCRMKGCKRRKAIIERIEELEVPL